MNKSQKVITGLSLGAAALALATLFSPLPSLSYDTPGPFRTDVALSVFFGLLYVVSGFLFTQGLGGFTNKLRSVYFTICAGMIILGLSFLQLPITSMLDAWTQPWATSGAIGLPFVLAGVVLFWGVHSYAKLIDERSIWSNWLVALALAGVGALVSVFLPHAPSLLTESTFDIGVALRVAPVLLILSASIAVFRIRQSSGSAYAGALAWLFTALFVTSLALAGAIGLVLAGLDFAPAWYIALDVVYTISAVLWLVAGYAFTKVASSIDESLQIAKD